jgi:2-oxo-4-hydroxy-4-carboxy--5-ureidoimidazoline (OHCU) decarboxylase
MGRGANSATDTGTPTRAKQGSGRSRPTAPAALRALLSEPTPAWEVDPVSERLRAVYDALGASANDSDNTDELRAAERTLRAAGHVYGAARLTAMRLLRSNVPDPSLHGRAIGLMTQIHPDDQRLLAQTVHPSTETELQHRLVRAAYQAAGGITVEHGELTAAILQETASGGELNAGDEALLLADVRARSRDHDDMDFRFRHTVASGLNIWLEDEPGEPPSEVAAAARRAQQDAAADLERDGSADGAAYVSELEEVPNTDQFLAALLRRPAGQASRFHSALTEAFWEAGREHQQEVLRYGEDG